MTNTFNEKVHRELKQFKYHCFQPTNVQAIVPKSTTVKEDFCFIEYLKKS